MTSVFRLFEIALTRVAYPFLYIVLSFASAWRGVRAWGKRPTCHWERDYDGRPIAMVALYQKGQLRPDSVRLVQALRTYGCYVIAINTQRLDHSESLRPHCDCYIERVNFGRDFGSYKAGFHHLYRKGWHEVCPRLLMVNDSVFCVSDRIDTFISDIMTSETEVLGSTENYEISHHLGSFCIAVSNRILRHSRFRGFWRAYRNSDVRPRVIRQGEQKLSKVLKGCVSAASEFRTLYGTNEYLMQLRRSDVFVDQAIRNARSSDLTGWRRFSSRKVIDALRATYLLRGTEFPDDVSIRLDGAVLADRVAARDVRGILEIARADLKPGETLDPDFVRTLIISELTEVYMSGSQIHQNASTLLIMGLPIVKLDGLYRGMFEIQDIQMITDQLPKQDALELQRLLLERPYGGDALRGWQRAAFMRGLI
jgi:hypothetical protein